MYTTAKSLITPWEGSLVVIKVDEPIDDKIFHVMHVDNFTISRVKEDYNEQSILIPSNLLIQRDSESDSIESNVVRD